MEAWLQLALLCSLVAVFALLGLLYKRFDVSSSKAVSKAEPASHGAAIEDLEKRTRKLETGLKAIETEWENAYQSLRKMAGRASKEAGLERGSKASPPDAEPSNSTRPPHLTRQDILRAARSKQ